MEDLPDREGFSNRYYVYCLEHNDKVCHVICNAKDLTKLKEERFITVNGEKISSTSRSSVISWICSHYEAEDIDIRTAYVVGTTTELPGITKRRVKTMEDLKW